MENENSEVELKFFGFIDLKNSNYIFRFATSGYQKQVILLVIR